MNILGIDTSCDETAAAVVADGKKILSNIVASQVDLHQKYGGIVPELASRKHVESINYIIDQALTDAGISFNDIGAIAVTNRPGLIGALLVGLSVAKSLAYCYNLPFMGINHVEGHVYANFIAHDDLPMPNICLTVAGGHTMLIEVHEGLKYRLLGSTQDDAAGEAYDKVAQYLGLGFPGGRIIDDLAKKGKHTAIGFPRPLLNSGDYQFSFSGLKTAVRYFVDKAGEKLPPIEDIAASFQTAVVDVLVQKTIRAAREKNAKAITLTGGVAANSQLRHTMRESGREIGVEVYYPPIQLCTDNAAMIAGIGYHKYQEGLRDGLDLNAYATASIA